MVGTPHQHTGNRCAYLDNHTLLLQVAEHSDVGLPHEAVVATPHQCTECTYLTAICYCYRLLNKVTWDYRMEQWWPLLTSILETSLKCAYLTARVQEYTANCMELIGKSILSSHTQTTKTSKGTVLSVD